MDHKDESLQEFSLEDIMKEFGEAPEESGEESQIPEPQAEPETEPVQDPESQEPVEEPAPQQVVGDTIRIDSGALAREMGEALEQTQRFTVGDQDPEPAQEPEPQAEPEKPEPFSGDWEPEYDQPISDYVPPQPIIFRPRSRLRELKRKLIAGPERRYYELSEQGVGKLQVAMFLSFIVVLLSAGATVLYELGCVQEDRLKLMIFGQFFAILLSALLGSYQLLEGFLDIFRLRFSLNSLLVFTFAVCCADGVFCLQELRVPCCAAFSLQVMMSLWSAYHKRTTEMNQMDTMRKATHLDSLAASADYYGGQTGILRGEAQVEDFMDHYSQSSGPEKAVGVYAVLALLAAVAAGVLGWMRFGFSAAFQAAAVTLLAAAPASFFVTISRPTAILEKRLHKLGAVLCGWQGVKGLAGKVVFPLDHEDLFPLGTAKMNGVKFYGDRDPDDVVAYATAVIRANGGGLVPLFERLLDSRNGRNYDVENLRAYEIGGVGGEVNGESVLMGTLTFMKEMGVEIPEGMRVNQAVYMAIDGELSGLFAITYEKDRSSAAGMRTLCSYRNVKNVLVTSDFMLTESFIRSRFGVRTKRIAFPERPVREELLGRSIDEGKPALAITTQDGLAPKAYALTGARVLRSACRLGVTVHILAGTLGVAMMLVLTYYGALHLLTPANMFAYELLWMIPGLLLTEWARSV